MDQERNFFSDIYNDFFGDNSLTRKVLEEKGGYELNEFPKIEVSKPNEKIIPETKSESVEFTKEQKDEQMQNFFEAVDKLYITDDSKELIKKMIGYARKYQEGSVKQFIPFNMRIYSDNSDSLYDITDAIINGLKFFGYITDGDAVESSFYLIDNAETLSGIYKNQNSIVVLKDFDGLNNLDKATRDKILNVLESSILDHKENKLTIIVDKNKEKIDEIFSNNIILRDKIFDFAITSKNPDSQDIYQTILEKIKENHEVTEEFEVGLLDYVVATFPKTTLSYSEYIESTHEKVLFNQSGEKIELSDIPEYEKDKTNEEIFAELNELVGLENVKQMLKDLVSLIEFKNKTKDQIKVKDTNLHMIFLGNPGTGKTTVARMVAGILYNLKYVSQNKLIEVSSKDLVAEYVGQTAPKTMAVIEKAMGGVLFVDEAYSLASKPGQNNIFNEECVATLIQAMENYRDNLVVILAGYSKEMDDFLKTNSGIASRVGYTMTFADYTVDELIAIFKNMVKKAGFEIDEKAIEKAKKIIEEFKDTENFGNARFVRNLYEKTVIKHATNTKDKKRMKSLKTIVEEDITAENLIKM